MKNSYLLTIIWLVVFAIPLAGTAVGETEYEEELHYFSVIPEQPGAEGDRVQVTEFFLYTCPHCYNLEPHLENWLRNSPKNVDFDRVPAVFSNPALVMQAKTYYALRLLGVADELHEKIFHAIHEQGLQLQTQLEMEEFLDQQGVDLAAYRKAMKSFAVQTQSRRAGVLADRYDVRAVPAIVVDGKYRTTGLQGKEMMEVTDYLIERVEQGKGLRTAQ